MKKPRPPPDEAAPPEPPPEIISAATTTSQVIPMPTSMPTQIDGKTPGRIRRRKMVPARRAHRTSSLDQPRSMTWRRPRR